MRPRLHAHTRAGPNGQRTAELGAPLFLSIDIPSFFSSASASAFYFLLLLSDSAFCSSIPEPRASGLCLRLRLRLLGLLDTEPVSASALRSRLAVSSTSLQRTGKQRCSFVAAFLTKHLP